MGQKTHPGVSADGSPADPTGLTALRSIRDGRSPQISLAGLLDFDLTTVEPGRVGCMSTLFVDR